MAVNILFKILLTVFLTVV